jgi:limonene-1,2-epoxide hydrolase
MTPQETVEAFIAAWNRRDMETVYAMMADDIIWDNIPLAPAKGIEAVRAMMDGFPPMEACNWIVHAIAANGNTVLTERTDGFTLAGGKQASIRVMGVFEINADGKICAWRDYFDSAEFEREFRS